MSDSDEADDKGKAEFTSRMWAESEPGPSRCPPSRQGYCGYCRVLYGNLDQHLSSLRHLDSVRSSSRGSAAAAAAASSSSSSRTRLTLLERFLQDVLLHHPHRYNDPRPSHADLPSVSAPPLPRAELDELRFSDDSRSLGTRDHLTSSERSANQQGDDGLSQSGEGGAQERLSAPMREQEDRVTPPTEPTHSQAPPTYSQAPPPQSQAPPSVHRKAHRKTNRRKTSESSGSSRPPRDQNQDQNQNQNQNQDQNQDQDSRPQTLRDSGHPGAQVSRRGDRGQVTSAHGDALDRTIEEVIQMCCCDVAAASCPPDDAESFHFSLPVTVETQSDEWDSPVQVVLQRAHAVRDSPVQVSGAGGRSLVPLTEARVQLQDRVYSHQLVSTLHGERREGGVAGQEQGFWTLPIEQVLPAPAHIPESFRGKSLRQIEQEDEEKVEELVREFRRERFICYFDSESLARFGRRSHRKKRRGDDKGEEPHAGVLPLLDHDDNDSVYERRRRRRRRRRGRGRSFRMASRCQVVKVSHSTQTVRLVVPAVRQAAPEATPPKVPAANQSAAEQTPSVQTWRRLPPSYSHIITPVQPRTSLVYLLCSPSSPAPSCTPAPGSASKRSRKKRRPLDLQGLKVKYKRLPVRFYDPGANRILKAPPKGRGPAPSSPPPPCVRQLFRSLSPDLNSDRAPGGEGPAGATRVKGFLLGKDAVRGRGRTPKAPPPPRGRGGRRERTRPLPSRKRTRAQATPPHATPPQPRREGLRRLGPAGPSPSGPAPSPPHSPSTRRGRSRRGRQCKS